jgi:glutamate-1-semialdehyde 2,1-aminomutase
MAVFDNSAGSPLAPHAGTFSANPLSMVAGTAALKALTPEAVERLNDLGARLRTKLQDAASRLDVEFSVTGLGSAFKIHPKRIAPRNNREAYLNTSEQAQLHALWAGMQERGFVFASHGLGLLSTPMTATEIDAFADAFADTAHKLRHS